LCGRKVLFYICSGAAVHYEECWCTPILLQSGTLHAVMKCNALEGFEIAGASY
jgi:hypothetical protein